MKMKEKISYWLTVIVIAIVLILASSCRTTRNSELLLEDELFITRKYVGNFLEYRITPPQRFTDPTIVWVKTTQDSIYGKISIYSKECQFKPKDRLYLRRQYQTPGIWGYWEYRLENNEENPITYRVSEFQYGKKVLVQDLF
jgi:hypothetical protein